MRRVNSTSVILILILALSSFLSTINILAEDIQDYRSIVFEDNAKEPILKPTAQFSLTYNDTVYYSPEGKEIDSFSKVIFATVGDTVTIQDMSRSNRGKSLKEWDFQYSRPDGDNKFFKTKAFEKSYILDVAGTHTFSLCVRDTVENEAWTYYWGNWSDNGNHQVIGNNPGADPSDPSDDFDGYWYFTRIVVIAREKSYTLQEKHINTKNGAVLSEIQNKDIEEDTFTTSARSFNGYKFIGSRAGYSWDDIADGETENISSHTADFDSSHTNAFHYYYYEPLPGLFADFAIKHSGSDYTDKELTVSNVPVTVNLADLSVGDSISNWKWEYKTPDMSSFQVFANTQNPTKELDNESTYTFRLTVQNAMEQKSAEHYVTVKKGTPPPPSSTGKPPIAVITGPMEKMAGESITFSGASSLDPDGTIVKYIWNIPGANTIYTEPSGRSTRVWYPTSGEYDLDLTVEDNDGLTGDTMTTINITPPIPTAVIDIAGTFKENRKVSISGSSSYSPTYYPINKYTWSMTNSTDARYVGTFGSETTKDMILKKAQAYRFDLRVDNTYGLYDTETKTVTIVPDVAPIADFTVATQVLRDPNNSNHATITATNLSRSTDGDAIKKTVMFYAYDSDNDGNFDEESWYISKDGITWTAAGLNYSQLNNLDLYNLSGASNPANFVLKTQNVGKYKFEAKTIEDIPAADTIASLLTGDDYRTGITTAKPLSTKVVEVLNTAPTVSFEVKKKKPVDIFIFTDYTGEKLNGLQSAINVKKAQLNALNLDTNFVIVNSRKTVGSQSMKKYRFYRNYYFNVKVTDGSGTNLSITEYNPYFINAGGLWEERTDYDKPLSDITKNRHYSYYRYMGSTSVRNSNYEIDSLNYRLYDTSGGYVDTGFSTWYNNYGFYRDFNVWSITGVGVDDAWTRDTYISTDTFNVTSINLEQIQSMTLRTGSDRFAFLLSDSVGSDFSAGYGTGYAFGSLTDTVLNYIKANNFKVSVIAPQAILDANLIGEKVLDITSTGYFGFYTSIDGKTKSLGTLYPKDYGDVVYPYDRGASFGKVAATESSGTYNSATNYLIMQDGTVKKQTGMNDTFTTIPGLTGIVKKAGKYFLRANGDCLTEAGLLVAANVSLTSDNPYIETGEIQNGVRYDIFILNNGRLYATNETNTSPAYVYDEYYTYNTQGTRTGGPYLTLVTDAKACVGNYVLKTNGDVIRRSNVYYQSGTIRIMEGGWSGYYNQKIATGISSIKVEGDFTLLTTTTGSKKYTFMEKRARYVREEFAGWTYTLVGPYDDTGIVSYHSFIGTWGDSANFLLTSDGNLRFFGSASETNIYLSYILNAPIKLSNVKSFDGKIALTNDGKVYYLSSSGSGGCKFTLLNISNVVKTASKEYQRLDSYNTIKMTTAYLLTNDHTLYAVGDSMYGQAGIIGSYITTPVVANKPNVTLTQPGLNYLTLRDVCTASLNNRYYTAGQYTQALNDILAAYTADPSYSTNYIVVGDTVDYKVIYRDYENDAKLRDYWTHSHDPDYFENSMGTASFHGQTLSAPVTTFNKTGKYTINIKVRDNPKNDVSFDNYRLYNQGIVSADLYVHRLGVPVIKAVVSANGPYFKLEATDGGSYDLDHISRDDKGIIQREWRWKNTGELAWHNERMMKTDCLPEEEYNIQLRVKDVEGFWSDWKTVEIKKGNPPVALFTIEKNPLPISEHARIKDQSYPQSFSTITKWHWIVKKLNVDGSVPAAALQNGVYSGSNNSTVPGLEGYDGNVITNYSTYGVGTYRIYLRVKDSSGYWSDGGTDSSYDINNFCIRDLIVLESFKMSSFRVVKVRDLHLESYYYNPNSGTYDDRPMGVNEMAVDYQNFGGLVDGLTKGYLFEFEIDTANFNDNSDTIEIIPHFYTCDSLYRDAEERDIYWENSYHEILKAGGGGHSPWAFIELTGSDRIITSEDNATWRGSYLIPGTAWAVPKGTSPANAKTYRINRDIIVSFDIKGYRNGEMKYDYNLQQWPVERTLEKHPYEIGDVIRYSYRKSNLDDSNVIINRP